ncbi:MAG: hypothetical protein RLZ55_1350 [Actinomycetota bacterium]
MTDHGSRPTHSPAEPRPPSGDPTLADVMAAMERLYPTRLAEGWDAVGLVCGDPERPVRRILVAVDPVAEVVDEALACGADLLITHHPLLLGGVHGVPATTPEGRVVMRLIEAGCALLCAHTNADSANPGVSDALAEALGLRDLLPLQRVPESERTQLLVVYVPPSHVDAVLDAAAAAGAGQVGDYRRCAFVGPGEGTYDAPPAGRPFIGGPGQRGTALELRVEVLVPAGAARRAVDAVLSAHPYDQPAYVLLAAEDVPRRTGIGRVGVLPGPVSLAGFAAAVAAGLPATEHGVRVAGDLGAAVSRVAVCGGAGDSLLADAEAAGADVYVTADLRHHRVQEHLAAGGCAVIDVAHWASEWPWCAQVAHLLPGALADVAPGAADSVEVLVSEESTDPWSARLPSAP